ncbi:MAG: DUF485 domain-containing protein [Anaerolineales bacterium]
MNQQATSTEAAFEQRKTRIGIRMAILYSLVYAGFVALSVFQPTWMGVRAVLGLNLAVTYGMGLIIIAVIFAVIYNHLCRVPPPGAASQSTGTQER